jgi:hypothetical protein
MKFPPLLLAIPPLLLAGACTYAPGGAGGSGSSGYLAGLGVTEPVASRPINPFDYDGYWDGAGVAGSPAIRINRSQQKAYFYKGSQLVGVSPVSTGTPEHQTPSGSFKITQKNPDHRSNLYGIIRNTMTGEVVNDDADARTDKPGPNEIFEGAPMPNFMRFNGGVGMHTGFLPGYPASHGCVRMPDHMARVFFENAPVGTPVVVE